MGLCYGYDMNDTTWESEGRGERTAWGTLTHEDRELELVLVHHPASACEGNHCCLHNPSDHHMVDWEMNWRPDRGIMERLCPEHGTGHPDPDDIAYLKRVGRDADAEGIHGCCGCCWSGE
jgi:hypothetical protein